MSGKRICTAVLLAAGLALAACGASTKIVDSWKAPGAGPQSFKKVLALAIVKNDAVRENAENAIRANIHGPEVVQSYKVLSAEDLKNREQAKERLRQEGFDGVVALRLVSAEQELGWAPGVAPVGFWGSYDTYYSSAYYPSAEVYVETVVRVEINVYSLTEDKLIWGGVSESIDPKGVQDLIAKIAEAAGRELRRQGLLAS